MLNLPTSGNWTINNSNTPFNRPKIVAVDNPYLTKDEFITNELAIGLGITASSPIYTSGRLDRLLVSASAEVNRICRRWFDSQTIDETKTGIIVRPWNPQLVSVILQNSPYSKINSIYFQVLKWFIQIDTSSGGYLQDFPDLGMYKIVPLLSNSGNGAGSPMPAEIVDKVPLGVLWTNYTFGYGKQITGQTLVNSDSGVYKDYQAPLYARLFAPSQTINVYVDGVLQATSAYKVSDYANGIITFNSALTAPNVVTIDYTSNESVPFDIKEAVALLVGSYIGSASSNPTGATGYSTQTFSINWSDKGNGNIARAKELLALHSYNTPVII
jgi:hypothetical protein